MATNKVYYTPGTARTFKNTGGDTTFTLKNIANGAGRISAQWDRGSGSLPARLKVEVVLKFGSAVTIGNVCRVYLYCTETSANVDGGTSDAALTVETQLNNYQLVNINSASANTVGPFYSVSVVECYGRYVTVGWWNASGQTSDNADGTSYVILTPMPDDIQAAA